MAKLAPWTVRAPSFPPVSATEPNPYHGKSSSWVRGSTGSITLFRRQAMNGFFRARGGKLREDANGSPSIPLNPIQLSFGRFVEVTEFIGLGDETEQESTESNPEEAT